MKKLFAIVLCLVMVLSLVACGKETAEDPTTTEPTTTEEPTTTTEPITSEDITEEVTEEFTEEVTEIVTEAIDLTSTEAVDVLKALVSIYNTTNAGTDFEMGVVGGGYENANWESPDVVALTEVDFLTYTLLVPETEQANLTAAASAIHMMNTNNFCAGAYNLAEGTDVAAFAAAMQANIQGNQWMCGFPETLVIADLGGCVVVVYGNAQLVELFGNTIVDNYTATVLYNEPIAG